MRRVVHEVPVGEVALFVGLVLRHRRHHDPVRELEPAQAEFREHRCRAAGAVVVARLAEVAFVPLVVGGGDEARIAHDQVVVGDRLRAAHHHHRELEGVHVPRAVHALEPGERDVGVVLDDLARRATCLVVGLERACHAGLAVREHGVGERDRALHRELAAGADREVRRRLRVAEDDDVADRPAVAEDAGELTPVRAVQQQPMALELLRVDALELGRAAGLVELREPVTSPARVAHLEHPGRVSRLVLVGVRADDPVLGLAEEVVELVHRAGRAHPAEPVRLRDDRRLETVAEVLADRRVDAVGGEDHVGVGEARLQLGRRDLDAEVQGDANGPAALLEDVEQGEPRHAAEAVARATHLVALVVDRDVVPIGEFAPEALERLGVAREELLERLVREHDAEAEGVVGAVLLVDLDVPVGTLLLREQREVEPPGAATDHHDLHSSSPAQGRRHRRGSAIRGTRRRVAGDVAPRCRAAGQPRGTLSLNRCHVKYRRRDHVAHQ